MDITVKNFLAKIHEVPWVNIGDGALTKFPGVITVFQTSIPEYRDLHVVDAHGGIRIVVPYAHNKPVMQALEHWHYYGRDFIDQNGSSEVMNRWQVQDSSGTVVLHEERAFDLLELRSHRRSYVIPAVMAALWQARHLQLASDGGVWASSKRQFEEAYTWLCQEGADMRATLTRAAEIHAVLWSGDTPLSLLRPTVLPKTDMASRSSPA